MTDSFPRQQARTRNFSLGAPRSFQVSPDGGTVAFLRSAGGADPVTCLWALDVATGAERLIADPARLAGFGGADDDLERARRERVRERATGIVSFATDAAFRVAAFILAGRVYVAELAPEGEVRELVTVTPAADARPDPSGTLVAYTSQGALRVVDVATGEDRVAADSGGAAGISYGVAEFVAAEEMDRGTGYWWGPDSTALLAARVDENPVQRWYISDPASPAEPGREIRYPSAGTPNAAVTAFIVNLAGEGDGQLTEIAWDSEAFPYLVTASWPTAGNGGDGEAAGGMSSPARRDTWPLLVVQSRDQRELRLLSVDPGTGQTAVLRADTDPAWTEIVPGVPARTASGAIAWTADSGGTRRLLVAPPDQLAAAKPVTPDGLQVRQVLDVDGDVVLFAASADDPAQVGLWLAGPHGLTELPLGEGVHDGRRAGGTTVAISRSLSHSGTEVTVARDGAAGPPARITSLAERPSLPDPRPILLESGPRGIRTAIVLPSWHEPGSGLLPVICDPYGGPHAQRVLAARDAYWTPQWLAEQGFAVVIADGRGTPGRGPDWEHAVARDLAGPVLEDQVAALHAAAAHCGDLDLSRVGIRGWSFGGYLAALAVLRAPAVFHAGVAGAPVTDWRLYDTHYTERYLGLPQDDPQVYERSSLAADAAGLTRPLMIIHGLADDNVVVAHSLRLSSALLAAGRPHTVLPLTGVTHMATQEEIAENLLLLQVDFLRGALTPGAANDGAAAP
ncbi:MAG: prolyl oligopeptidase family serine peptidase [Streptosporangiaceae bacterium]